MLCPHTFLKKNLHVELQTSFFSKGREWLQVVIHVWCWRRRKGMERSRESTVQRPGINWTNITSSLSQLAVAVVVFSLFLTLKHGSPYHCFFLFCFLNRFCSLLVIFDCLTIYPRQKSDIHLICFYRLIHRNSSSCLEKEKCKVSATTPIAICISLTECFNWLKLDKNDVNIRKIKCKWPRGEQMFVCLCELGFNGHNWG